jgi:kynurenine formamidase
MLRVLLAAAAAVAAGAAAAGCERAAPAAPPPFWSGTIVDLSHPYDDSTVFWPTSDRFRLEPVTAGVTPQGYYYAANNFFTAEHGGTHVDSPIHFAEGRLTVDRLPLERLIGPAVVVDVAAQSERDADYQVSVQDFEAWESSHGPLPDRAIVLIRTGFSARWPDSARYLGTAERGPAGVANLHFPGLHPDGARWLVEERTIAAVGIDTASIDFGQSTLFETHRTLAARDVPALENLTGLDRLPPSGAAVIALPMKIGGGSGAPLRAVAILPSGPGS